MPSWDGLKPQKNKVIFVDGDAWYLKGAVLNNPAIMLKEISAAMQKSKQ